MSTKRSKGHKSEKTTTLDKPIKKARNKMSTKRTVKKTSNLTDSTDEMDDHKKPGTAARKKPVKINSKKGSKLKPVKKNIMSEEKIFENASAEEDSASEIKDGKKTGTAADEKPYKISKDI